MTSLLISTQSMRSSVPCRKQALVVMPDQADDTGRAGAVGQQGRQVAEQELRGHVFDRGGRVRFAG